MPFENSFNKKLPYRDSFIKTLKDLLLIWTMARKACEEGSEKAIELEVLMTKTRAFLVNEFGEEPH